MVYVRRESGVITAVFANPQKGRGAGVPEEALSDSHPDVVAYRLRPPAKHPWEGEIEQLKIRLAALEAALNAESEKAP